MSLPCNHRNSANTCCLQNSVLLLSIFEYQVAFEVFSKQFAKEVMFCHESDKIAFRVDVKRASSTTNPLLAHYPPGCGPSTREKVTWYPMTFSQMSIK